MGSHARTGARRVPAARAAIAAVLAALAGSVVVGMGGAAEAPAALNALPAAAAAPAPELAAPPADRLVDPAALDGSLLPAEPTQRTAPRRAESQPAQVGPEVRAAAEPAAESTATPTSVAPRAVPARTPAASPVLVPGTPCTATARACVDLVGRKAWLIENGVVQRGPVSVMAGDRDDPTPRGTFVVQWKAEQYTSREYLVQMPYAIFFAEGGIAFHEGRQDTYSAGCVKLVHDDAVAWFAFLQVGDEVQVR